MAVLNRLYQLYLIFTKKINQKNLICFPLIVLLLYILLLIFSFKRYSWYSKSRKRRYIAIFDHTLKPYQTHTRVIAVCISHKKGVTMTFEALNKAMALKIPVKCRDGCRVPTAIIKRYDSKQSKFFYQVELADTATSRSVTIVPLSDVVDGK